MKFKYYLRGCGLGILVASIVLMVSFHSQNKTMDDTAVMERASELGMIMPETEIVSTEADSQLPESPLFAQKLLAISERSAAPKPGWAAGKTGGSAVAGIVSETLFLSFRAISSSLSRNHPPSPACALA